MKGMQHDPNTVVKCFVKQLQNGLGIQPEKAPEQSPLRVGGAFLSMMAALALVWLPVQARFLLLHVCFMFVHFILPRVAL